jgi:general secretion pathway protein D
VLLKYDRRPLREVMDDLARLADINIHLDQQGMAIEGVTYDTPVSINLSKEISLKSALLLILEPLRMNYVISNDVLKITSGELTMDAKESPPRWNWAIAAPATAGRLGDSA